MKWIGVITGDIVDSTKILESGQREKLLNVLHQTIAEINAEEMYDEIKIEIYRGDSFQIFVKDYTATILISIILRSILIANSTNNIRWDARLGIGIGKGEFITTRIAESDGEAFHLSGLAFDKLGKSNRLAVLTPDKDFNGELEVSTAFADDIISSWTVTQASTIYPLLLKAVPSQKALAEMTGKSEQAISKTLINSKINLIIAYYLRAGEKINTLNKEYNKKI